MHKSTLQYCKKGWQPSLSDWNSYDVWQKKKEPDIEKRARLKATEIIENAEVLLDSSTAKALREFIKSFE